MDLGFAVPISGSWATPQNQVELAQRAEELGYRSLWTFQRLLYPAEPPLWAPVYAAVHDPIVTLSYLAGVTSRVRLGLAVVNTPFYSPVVLAKQLTTLDIVSGGRLVAGLGLGWSREEFAAAGVDYEQRGARGEEFLRCLDAIWTQDVVEFAGEFYTVPRCRIDPKPVQQPRPHVVLGGSAPRALERAGRLADGWVAGSVFSLDRTADAVRAVRAAAETAGRDPDALDYVVRGVVRVRDGGAGVRTGPGSDSERRLLSGSFDEIEDDLGRLAAAGVTETFLDLNFDEEVGHPDADADASTERARAVLERFAPATG
ncbi:MAG TPA: TIGR03619 family F420-dependent LLM class oxidoreductase [Mycobacteriales bacterium]|nr:TIGR03619 family F420-dependent LLM class oxidoreductase [Mycobacteriales bacterium]